MLKAPDQIWRFHTLVSTVSPMLKDKSMLIPWSKIEENNIGQLTVRLLCSTENQGYKGLAIPCENSKTFLNSQFLIYPKALAHYLKHCFEQTFILSQRDGRIFVDQAVLHELLKHIGSLKHCDPLLYYLCSHTSLDCLNSEQPTWVPWCHEIEY